MKNEIFTCDICGTHFEIEEAVGDFVVFSDNNKISQFEQVCVYCIGTIKSALQRCGQKNVGSDKKIAFGFDKRSGRSNES